MEEKKTTLFNSQMGKPKYKSKIRQEEEKEIKTAFDLFDTDNSGIIDEKKLKVGLKSVGYDLPLEKIRQMIANVDPERKGHVVYEDFYKMMTSKFDPNEKIAKEEILNAFKLIDDDESGKISFKNLKRVVKELNEPLSDDDIREMILEADRDNDGEISYKEFIRVMWKSKVI